MSMQRDIETFDRQSNAYGSVQKRGVPPAPGGCERMMAVVLGYAARGGAGVLRERTRESAFFHLPLATSA